MWLKALQKKACKWTLLSLYITVPHELDSFSATKLGREQKPRLKQLMQAACNMWCAGTVPVPSSLDTPYFCSKIKKPQRLKSRSKHSSFATSIWKKWKLAHLAHAGALFRSQASDWTRGRLPGTFQHLGQLHNGQCKSSKGTRKKKTRGQKIGEEVEEGGGLGTYKRDGWGGIWLLVGHSEYTKGQCQLEFKDRKRN